jgi:hypothetical protein
MSLPYLNHSSTAQMTPPDLEVLSAGITTLGASGLTHDVAHHFVFGLSSNKHMHLQVDTHMKLVLPHWISQQVLATLPTFSG